MYLPSAFLLASLPLILCLPFEPRTPTIAAPLPATSLTPDQIQTLACLCKATTLTGLGAFPGASILTTLCAAYPNAVCTTPFTSSSSGGTSLPISGGLPGNLIPIAKEKRSIQDRQVGSTGGGLSLPDIPSLALGAASVPEAATVLSGVTNSAPGLLGTASQLGNLAGLGGILARNHHNVVADRDEGKDILARNHHNVVADRDAENEIVARNHHNVVVADKRQLSGLTGALGGITGGLAPASNPVTPIVTGLVGSLTGGLGGLGGGSILARNHEKNVVDAA